MYAIIQILGHQYQVVPGEELEIDNLPLKEGDKHVVNEVLLLVKDSEVKIGQPFIPKTEVILKVVKKFRGEKIHITRFKAKSRYTRRIGFRQDLTRVLVEMIKSGEEKYQKNPPKRASTTNLSD